ncbi:MAG: sugar transferase [Burkholderiaceae bacterium]
MQVSDLASFYERELGILHVDNIKASWLIFGSGFDQGLLRDVVKRVFDVFVSVALFLATLPILALAALAVVLESGFPILYRQERVGQGGTLFTIPKLRSMVANAESAGNPQWAKPNDAGSPSSAGSCGARASTSCPSSST